MRYLFIFFSNLSRVGLFKCSSTSFSFIFSPLFWVKFSQINPELGEFHKNLKKNLFNLNIGAISFASKNWRICVRINFGKCSNGEFPTPTFSKSSNNFSKIFSLLRNSSFFNCSIFEDSI
eukprot:TRINITY_DN1650_c0_g1_i3.p1 TRINITY_DN1650_c0_g1~~TRINITY_DN1650_c0_g1_i3.p1  ORF type:complete len:120 (+),score=29.90 TRINITY_DN1650_c0_g1_i3:233-592(+)